MSPTTTTVKDKAPTPDPKDAKAAASDPALDAKIAELDAKYDADLEALKANHVVALYPAARYHTDGRSQTVEDEAADKLLGAGWSDKAPDPLKVSTIPGWRYHLTKPPVFVNTKAEDDALGAGWYPTVALAAASAPK